MSRYRRRRIIAGCVLLAVAALLLVVNPDNYASEQSPPVDTSTTEPAIVPGDAQATLDSWLSKAGLLNSYDRDQFGAGWGFIQGCSVRDAMLQRDLVETVVDAQCAWSVACQ